MKNVKEITIQFSDCGLATVPMNRVGTFLIDGVQTVVTRVALDTIARYERTGLVLLEIFKEADSDYIAPDGTRTTIFNRITQKSDITALFIKYEDDTEDQFLVSYDEGDLANTEDAPNLNEDIYISSLGNLYITISEGRGKVRDFFDINQINDKDAVEENKAIIFENTK